VGRPGPPGSAERGYDRRVIPSGTLRLGRRGPPPARARGAAATALVVLLGGGLWAQQRLSPGSPPVHEVLLFVLDDVAAADLALYGGAVETPWLERLAREGVVFTNAYANPVCEPTRRSLEYGRWWLRGNGRDCTASVSPDTPPLAEPSMAEALPGHHSAFVGKWHLGAAPGGGPWECAPLVRGWDYWLAGLPSNVLGDLFCMGSIGYREWLRVESGPGGCGSAVSEQYHPRVVVDSFLAAWPSLPPPRLFSVNSNLAHAPFHRPPADMLPAGYPPTDTNRAKFEAMVVALDSNLGQLLSVVDLAHTMVVVIGDNGTPGAVAPEPSRAKNTTFERGIRVPLVIAGGPTRKAGRQSDELVHVVDLWSTVVQAGGGDPSHPTSRSLMPILQDVPHPPIRDFALCGTHWETPQGDRCAVSADGFKLRQLDLDGDRVADLEELYDLRADPGEHVNLLADLPEVAQVMRAWIESVSP